MYGPTEGTCGATIKRLLPGKPVNIGPPNPSTRVYILDRNQRLVPPGVIGEIYLAGVQIARGYIGRSTETAERFLKDTISGVPGERMYRTGDRGYWNSHGEIECLGRNDRQIKLRGFRLDLNDLEIRIANAIPEITAVAIAQKDDYLVAMVQPASLEVAEVRSKIVQALQANAVPRLIKAVDKFPITPIGKVDYKAIVANMDSAILISTRLLNTSTEKTLATEWRKYLVLEEDVPITCDSSFACLGGHSVSQMLLASGLTSVFQCQIPVSLVIQSATLRDLALAIDYVRSEQPPSNDGLGEVALGEHKISPMEREWWRKYQLNRGTSSFNVNFACAIEVASVDIDRLIMSWNVVLARHLILCSQYVADEELGVKRIYSEAPPMVNRVASVDIEDEINRPFYLDRQDPIRVTISGSAMVVVISHIICDLTTLQILFREVANVYSGKCLSSVNKSYMDTTLWNKLAPSPDLAFWKDYLGDMPNSTHTSIIRGRKSYTGTSYAVKIPKSIYQRLARFVTAHKYTMHQVALASVAIALQRDSSATDIILGGPYQNRLSESNLDTVGLFLEPLPIRVSYTPGQQSGAASQAFLQSVQQSSQSALAHAVPWNQLLSHFQITPEFPNHPLLETMVTFHDDPHATKLAVPGLEPLLTWTEGSKFKLLCEFSALSEQTLLLRLEYDTDCFSKREVKDLASLISMGLEGLVDGVEYEEIKKGLRGVVKGDLQGGETGESDEPEASEKKDLFKLEKIAWGTRLSEL
jgi:gliotoxin/aspirochlorine biosynthesis peptide synthetase